MLELVFVLILVLTAYKLGSWEGENRILEAWEIQRELEMELLEKLLTQPETK